MHSHNKCLLASRPSIRLHQRCSHWTDLFYTRDFHETLSRNFIFGKNCVKVGDMHEDLGKFYCFWDLNCHTSALLE